MNLDTSVDSTAAARITGACADVPEHSCTSVTDNATCTASSGAPWTNTSLHWQAPDVSMTILNNTSVGFSCVANFHPGHISVMPGVLDGNPNIATAATIQSSC
ncbi:hypothetical protein LGN17_34545 [Burkholderia sp. AU30280]|uniref:hypothetical protein n=1 Tax=Burkholderia sp. AU30280 TaxID=2879628 RepID=UPI001CF16468|nr:hypothetical protein [Burkholderia sp. AU30280]MCA8277605.1 hypothetical protein [Burkholderia sp. AU30280]